MVKRRAVHRDIHREAYASLPRYPLMVCATLVQNPANLGGLCRTCEAFRLEGLVLADLTIAQMPAFRNLAASTHYWQPLIACSADSLVNWLTQQHQAGYSLIALHTDSEATPLLEFTFPHRSILVLGQELTGIPAEIVAVCDRVITIPQFGLVESLNVQTAAAIAIYEYIRQSQRA